MNINSTYKNNSQIREFVNDLPKQFENGGTILYAERNIIKSFTLGGKWIVVKRFRLPSWPQRLIYSFFRKSKAERAFRNGIILHERGISTPCSIAYLEQWKSGLFEYGYYVTEYIDLPPICERLNDIEDFDRTLADAFAAFVADLHRKGILHHDLNSTNVLYQQAKGSYTFSLIDINRMEFSPIGKYPSLKQCMKNLTRFTGRMEVFEYVARQYAIYRSLDVDSFTHEALAVKIRHDKQNRRRKAFFRHFKRK